ncbi:unnamed protein product [Rotaria magnacalcarata]|uniref:PDZ domain-containing protein n=1 Tax=Rotaria magnacalcarata TaxID=392030 RepID=A0A816U253_9BILA|nr:unnamed protein product [Rotaria magnacalcarata]CAF2103406.1 unnamed protein product [Rotaria magnacalcarata]
MESSHQTEGKFQYQHQSNTNERINDIYKPDNDTLGLALEGTIDTENGKETDTRHYRRPILPDGVIGKEGTLKPGDELLEINTQVLYGKNHMYAIEILKFLKHEIKLVCARRKIQQLIEINGKTNRKSSCSTSFDKSTGIAHKAKSMVTLHSTDTTLSRTTRTRSLEAFSNLALWSNSTFNIELKKVDHDLGFSVHDYQDPYNPSSSPVIVVRQLVPGDVAQLDGRIPPGDSLTTVNDITLENMNADYSINILKSIPNRPDKLTVSKSSQYPKVINDKDNDDKVIAHSFQDVNNNNNQRLSRIGKTKTTAQIKNNHKVRILLIDI